MSTYTATAVREGNWWVIEVEGIGATQARTLTAAKTWARGLIEAMTGEAGAEVQVIPTLPDGALNHVRHARELMDEAEMEMKLAAREMRDATQTLLRSGMSQQDVAEILGVSRQRVQQLGKLQP